MLTRGIHCLYIEGEKYRKSDKNDLTIKTTCTSSYHENKTHAKFQNNGYKTVRGVALTRHPG